MQTDRNNNFVTFERNPQDIDFYISALSDFKATIKSLLRKDPETRRALLDASYKDILCLRMEAHDILHYMEELEERRIFCADYSEIIEAAGSHPLTYGND